MKRIQEITQMPQIKLKNVKINFELKLLQYQLNQLLYKYNNKYAFSAYIENFKKELVSLRNSYDRALKNKQAEELLDRILDVYYYISVYEAETPTPDAIDSTLKYLLFNYTQIKATIGINQELELLGELQLIKSIIKENHIPITSRIKNSFTLINQLKESIIKKLN